MTEKAATAAPLYSVVVNDEGQHSIWPAGREVPLGWTVLGRPADEAACLAYIEENWTDLRPLSVRGAGTSEVTDG
ncbi:MbtH family NRPS accessory protein [Streptomyces sp. SID5643]|jgi:MbtH protein|uniref:MbtH family protein n=1 Tax=Streptomyces sp. SID5643 TaxID=2690307 RepID=UPI00136F31DB|nr:MbtH family NRPS accessory protein [Streptomyces sp. SID5643]MZF89094.1 MbtH family NRPS accessory protein [Streptomyces sp. SID5643]